MMKVAFYPGCSLESTAGEYKISLIKACETLDLELCEIDDWNCCGASSAHSINSRLAITLPARNLFLASRTSRQMLVPCAACYSREKKVEVLLDENPSIQKDLENILQYKYEQPVKVQNLLEFFSDKIELIKSHINNPLSGLKVVCYYGCLLTRPPGLTREPDYENPQSMDRIVQALGAETVDWSCKTECCGNSLAIPRSDIVINLVSIILQMALETGADAIITACPLCHMNLDSRQKEAELHSGEKFRLPILFISELMMAAFGDKDIEQLWKKHIIDPSAKIPLLNIVK